MGAKHAICIGIANSIPEVPLPGAINDARDFSQWADRNRYTTKLITDEDHPVTFDTIRTHVFRLARSGDVDRLIIYFAGHGAEPQYLSQLWLLSDWKENPNEAINVSVSCAHGWTANINQIAIIGDACRNADSLTAGVHGGSIFPSLGAPNGPSPKWDKFLAVLPQSSSQGVEPQDGSSGYGIFTRCLLDALKFKEPSAITTRLNVTPPKQVVCSDELALCLEQVVPRTSGRIPGAVVQRPEVISGWLGPNDVWAERDLPQNALQPLSEVMRSRPTAKRKTPSRLDKAILALAEKLTALHPDSASQGVTVTGSEVRKTIFRDEMVKAGAYGFKTVAVEWASGKWSGVAEISKHHLTVVVADNRTVSVAYSPVDRGKRRADSYYLAVNDVIAGMALDPNGPWHKKILSDPKYLNTKTPDINRALVAAYAFARVGDIKRIDDMMTGYLLPLGFAPFDVALLSSWSLQRRAGGSYVAVGPDNKEIAVAGTFPLMTPGWGYLDPSDTKIDPMLFQLREGLEGGLWTTFAPTTGKTFAELIKQGAV